MHDKAGLADTLTSPRYPGLEAARILMLVHEERLREGRHRGVRCSSPSPLLGSWTGGILGKARIEAIVQILRALSCQAVVMNLTTSKI